MSTSSEPFAFDHAFLESVGLGALPGPEQPRLLDQVIVTLETRIGRRLAEQMTDEELSAVLRLADLRGPGSTLELLGDLVPNYRDQIYAEVVAIRAELTSSSAAILAATRASDLPAVPAPGP